MATLDEFVKNVVRRPANLPVSLGRDFRYSGGKAIIIRPNGSFSVVGLGIFASILECYDAPSNPADSNTLSMLLDSFTDTDIFKTDRLQGMAVIECIVQWTPLGDAYKRIHDAAEDLDKAYAALKQALGGTCSGEYCKKIEADIAKIKSTTSSENMMRAIFSDSSELGFLISCIPGWAKGNWMVSLPSEYQRVSSAYQDLRAACRTSQYSMSVSDEMKQCIFLQYVHNVRGVPDKKSNVIIVDDFNSLEALSKLGWKDTNILYRGAVDTKTTQLICNLNAYVICANIKGPNQYKHWLAEHT